MIVSSQYKAKRITEVSLTEKIASTGSHMYNKLTELTGWLYFYKRTYACDR